jgi:hypothetical protein
VSLVLLRLRNLLRAGGVVLLLVCGVSLYLFLGRVLVRGFRRFITHDPKGKVHVKRSQPRRPGVSSGAIVCEHRVEKVLKSGYVIPDRKGG